MSESCGYIPEWPAPATVRAFVTYRTGGCSEDPYASNNLATHVGDDPQSVAANRRWLNAELSIAEPCWLEQVHGIKLVDAAAASGTQVADGSYSGRSGPVCAVMTADCLPLLLCDSAGSQVAAVHCGWRGLAAGIISRSLAAFSASPSDLLAYLGPAISGDHYEVGAEVRQALAVSLGGQHADFSRAVVGKPGHFLVDLYALARAQLQAAGLEKIYGGDRCTFAEPDRFFSYRRDGVTGRMASLIWLT